MRSSPHEGFSSAILRILTLRSRNSLAAENLFLRKQLAIYQERGIKPRRISHPTRLTLLWLSCLFDWRSALTVVTPETFIGWHRQGFRFFWRRKCQAGRPPIPPELQVLILTGSDIASNAVLASCKRRILRAPVLGKRSAARFSLKRYSARPGAGPRKGSPRSCTSMSSPRADTSPRSSSPRYSSARFATASG